MSRKTKQGARDCLVGPGFATERSLRQVAWDSVINWGRWFVSGEELRQARMIRTRRQEGRRGQQAKARVLGPSIMILPSFGKASVRF